MLKSQTPRFTLNTLNKWLVLCFTLQSLLLPGDTLWGQGLVFLIFAPGPQHQHSMNVCWIHGWNAMLLQCKTLIKFLFYRFQRKQAIEYYKQVIKIKENAGTLANSPLVRNQLSLSLSDTLCKLGNCFNIFLLQADDFSLHLTGILCLFLKSLHLWSQQLLLHIIFNFLSLSLSFFFCCLFTSPH